MKNYEDLIGTIGTSIFLLFCAFCLYTTEYIIKDNGGCLEYSTSTGQCVKKEQIFMCVTEWNYDIVDTCEAMSLSQCIKKCNELDKWYN
jgi:hypothetical protein